MVKFGGGSYPPGYPDKEDFYMGKFTDILLEKAPQNIEFNVYSIIPKLGLDGEDLEWYKFLGTKLHLHLVHSGYADEMSSNYIKLTQYGKELLKHETQYNGVINNYHNSNVIQGSSFVNSNFNSSHNAEKTQTAIKKSSMSKIWDLLTQNKLISTLIAALIFWIIKYIIENY